MLAVKFAQHREQIIFSGRQVDLLTAYLDSFVIAVQGQERFRGGSAPAAQQCANASGKLAPCDSFAYTVITPGVERLGNVLSVFHVAQDQDGHNRDSIRGMQLAAYTLTVLVQHFAVEDDQIGRILIDVPERAVKR